MSQPETKNIDEITVVIVNDQQEVGSMWQRILNYAPGIHCTGTAASGEQAIELVRQLKPDVVLMDVMMPGIHGFEATRRILAEQPDTLVIIYSARTDIEEEAYVAGAVEALLMPIAPADLKDIIVRVYQQHRLTA